MNIIPSLLGTLSSLRRLPSRVVFLTAAILLSSLCARNTALAGSATWKTSFSTRNWNNASNWTPSTIPNGASDTATFDSSDRKDVSLSANTEVSGIVFNSGASAFTVTDRLAFRLTISGTGITNNSGIMQNFTADPDSSFLGGIRFANSATAGNSTMFTMNGGSSTQLYPGATYFKDTSTAGTGIFINNGSTESGSQGGGETLFLDNSTAGNGVFINNGGFYSGVTYFFGGSTAGNGTFTTNGNTFGFGGGLIIFDDNSSAGNGTFTNNGGAVSGAHGGATILGSSTLGSSAGNGIFINNAGTVSGADGGETIVNGANAGNATLIANGGPGEGGVIMFGNASGGGTARVEVFGNGNVRFGDNARRRNFRIGSIKGDGVVFLGANNLSEGSNNLSTIFSGIIQDGGVYGGIGGSLTKIGSGKLTLTGANLYSGGTIIKTGTLLAATTAGSATGTGSVQVVNSATLGGPGRISGAVTVGDGTHSGATLLGGSNATTRGTLNIDNTLTFNPLSTYKCVLNRTSGNASRINAVGVTINSGANFTLVDTGLGTLAPGVVLMVISNLSASPLAGTFANLADGSTFTSNGNTYKVNYKGGDGNDLTLTVVP